MSEMKVSFEYISGWYRNGSPLEERAPRGRYIGRQLYYTQGTANIYFSLFKYPFFPFLTAKFF